MHLDVQITAEILERQARGLGGRHVHLYNLSLSVGGKTKATAPTFPLVNPLWRLGLDGPQTSFASARQRPPGPSALGKQGDSIAFDVWPCK